MTEHTTDSAAPDWGSWTADAFADALAHLDDPQRERITLEPGDTFAGVIDGFAWVNGDSGPFPVMDAREYPTGREVSLGVGRTALRRQLARAQAQPGDLVAIKYQGLVTPESGGREYHGYAVRVARGGPRRPGDVFTEQPPADWDLLPDQPAADAPNQQHGAPELIPF